MLLLFSRCGELASKNYQVTMSFCLFVSLVQHCGVDKTQIPEKSKAFSDVFCYLSIVKLRKLKAVKKTAAH